MLSLLLIEYKHIAGDSSMEPIKPIQYVKGSSFDTAFSRQRPIDKLKPTVYFDGCASYECNVDIVTVSIQKVCSGITTGSTGPITVSLICCDKQPSDHYDILPHTYDSIGQFQLDSLFVGELFSDIKKGFERKNKFYRPCVALLLEIQKKQATMIVDWINFTKKPEPIPFMKGAASFKTDGDDVEFYIPRICSTYTDEKTGTLRVKLISSQGKFGKEINLGTDSHEIVAQFTLHALQAGQQYTEVRKLVKSINHLRRSQAILTLAQYQHGGYIIKDWHYFPPDPNVGSVFFSGNVSYQFTPDGKHVTLNIQKIASNYEGFTGGLKVALTTSSKQFMATKDSTGATMQNVGLFLADGLNKDQFYSNIVKTVPRNNIQLQRYMTMIVETKDVDGKYKVSDWRNFGLE